MTTYGITPEGFNAKPGTVIRAELADLFRSVFGQDIKTEPGSVIGNLIGVLAERESLQWDLSEALYNALDIDQAVGYGLDALARLVNTSRLEALPSLGEMTLVTFGGSLVTVPIGTQFSQPTTNVLFETIAAGDIPAATVTVTDADVLAIDWKSGNTVRYELASTDLSSVVAGHQLVSTNAANTVNNGVFEITDVDDGADWIEVTNLRVSDNSQNELGGSTISTTDGYVVIASSSVDDGAFAADPQTINTVNTPLSGLDFAANQAAFDGGRDRETDDQLRQRIKANQEGSTGGTLNAVIAQLYLLDGVTYVAGRENRTGVVDGDGLEPHSIEIVVRGGVDQEIGEKIFETKPAGAETNGSVGVPVTDSFGVANTMYFNRVSDVDVYLDVAITSDATYPADGDDQVKTALVDYFGTLDNGEDIYNVQLISAVVASVQGVIGCTIDQDTSFPPSGTAPIVIAPSEIGVTDVSKITVVS